MRFSIITCAYNSEEYIKKNIDSVKKQTYRGFEHIFIDGFSNDKTIATIKKYQSEFPRKVKLFQFKPEGIANAMNKGIEKSQGEYIIHLHSDDSFYNNKVLEKINYFIVKNNRPDLIYGKANFYNPTTKNKRIIPHRKIYHKINFWLLLITNYIPHQTVFIGKNIFKKYGLFNEQYKNSMDYEMWLRISKEKIKSKFIDEIICNFRIRNTSQSHIGKEICFNENRSIKNLYTRNLFFRKLINIIDQFNKNREIL
jgi:glycosyltransferase involved in cell wall biosynthesis